MLVFDLQAVQSAAYGERGVARYVSDLAEILDREHRGVVDVFAWNDHLPRTLALDRLELGDRLRSFSDLRGTHVDVLHVNSVFEPMFYGTVGPPVRADRLVVTCYDLIPYRFLDQYLVDPQRGAAYRARLGMVASADAVVTDSRSAADDVHELVGVARRRISVIGAGVGARFAPSDQPLDERLAVLRDSMPELGARFVLVPTGMDWRKNVPGAIAAFGRLPADVRDNHQLVLSCRVDAEHRRWIDDLAAEAGIADRLVITGFVSDDDLVRLYQSAELVMFPSFYEGFGLPVLEARRCGARVICSNASSLPEVLTDADARFDPHDIDDMASVLERALTDVSFTANLDRVPDAGFTWERTARDLVAVYRSLSTATVAETSERRSLAMITLLPPTPSGVAGHSERLARALTVEYPDLDLTLFVSGSSAVRPTGRFEVAELCELPRRWQRGEFDRVVYCFGNNPWHRDGYQMLQVVPGSVLLHDVRLAGMFDAWYRHQFVEKLYPASDNADEPMFALPVTRFATSVLVQSRHAAELVDRDAGVTAIDVGPLLCRQVDEVELSVEDAETDVGPPWIVSLGIASDTKRSRVFVEAGASLAARGVARAALVGFEGERFVRVGEAVVATGAVGDAEFDRWLRRASVAVQMRSISNGESSDVAAQALAFGVPLVVSDIGAMSELPDDVAVKVSVEIDAADLADVVADLVADPDRRAAMSLAARAYAANQTPAAQAERVMAALFSDC